MTHKKAIRYFKPRKKTPVRSTFRLMRVGSWRGHGFRSFASFSTSRLGSIVAEALSRDSQFNKISLVRKWFLARTSNLNRGGSQPKLKLRCVFVGRGRSTSQELFMTRHTFRKFLRLGMLPGFIKLTKI